MSLSEQGFKIEPIKYRSMGENMVENLRRSIIYGELKQGTRVTEMELAETSGVSRNVVREALLILSGEGLIDKERNRYSKVVEFEKKDVEDIFEFRIAIEKAAVKRCSQSRELCIKLGEYAHMIEQTLAKGGYDYRELIEADIDFHTYIVESSENKWLIDNWMRILGPMKMLLVQHMDDAQSKKSSHANLIGIISTGDYDKACQALESHIKNTEEVLLRNYE